MTFLDRRKSVLSLLMVALAACGLTSRLVMAQGGATGAITGTVLDPNGGAIPNATIQIIDAATGQGARIATTSSVGSFTVALLPPGNYIVIVNAAGFGQGRISEVRVRVTETTALDVSLKPSGVSEKVEVTAEVVTLNTQNATTGQTLEQQVVNGL